MVCKRLTKLDDECSVFVLIATVFAGRHIMLIDNSLLSRKRVGTVDRYAMSAICGVLS